MAEPLAENILSDGIFYFPLCPTERTPSVRHLRNAKVKSKSKKN